MATCKPGKLTIVKPSPEAEAAAENKWYGATTTQVLMDKYADSGVVGDTSIVGQDVNPYTGKPFTNEELKVAGVSDTAAYWDKYDEYGMLANPDPGTLAAAGYGKDGCGGAGGVCGAGGSGIPGVPGYEQSPEQQAWESMYGGQLADWIENPKGIPEETKAMMKQELFDTLKANEEENIRVMRNNMERRGITNSGFVYSNEQKIRATTTKSMAESIRNIEIQDSMMKLASWETAMGQTAQFLGYLSNESYLAYQPKLMEWQAKFDVYKMKLNQAYQQKNMQLQAQLTAGLNAQQNAFNMEMLQMELEATQQAAKTQSLWNIIGTIGGAIISSIFNPFKMFGLG